MFEQAFKNIDDALRKEAGCGTELDYAEQTSWLLFLKYLDGLVDGENSYQVSVVVKSLPAPEPKKNPYLIELIAVGFFEVNSDWSDPIKLLEINGATILYSAAREFLITITSRGPWGAIPLPATSFLALYNHNISARQQKEGDSAKGEKVKTQESTTPKS